MERQRGLEDWGRTIALLIGLLALVSAVASAGEEGKGEGPQEKYEICESPAQKCIDYMWEKMKNSGWVGVELSYDEKTKQYTVFRVLPATPAEEGGLKSGDVVLAMNGVPITGLDGAALGKVARQFKAGESMTYTVRREGNEHEIALTLAPMPAHLLARYIGEHLRKHHPDEAARP